MTAKRATRGPMTCRAGRCRIECPPGGCACIYVYETDSCNCECFGEERTGSAGVLALGNKIDVSVSGLPLGQVAARLDRLLLGRSVLVPAGRVKERVRLRLTGVRVSAALNALGLRTQRRTKTRSPKHRG